MLKNYILIAWRHLVKHTFFSVINVLCLAIGITFSLLIGVYVFNQYSINQSLKNADNQYLLKSDWKVKDMGMEITTPGPLANALKDEYPNLVANYYRYDPVTNVVSAGDKHFKEDIAIGDTTFISMYGFPLLYGDKAHPFTDNNSAVITETMAAKLFGNTNAIGKVISVLTTVNNENQDYKVSAVIKDIPVNSVTHLLGNSYNVFVPVTGNRYFGNNALMEDWKDMNYISAVELKKGVGTNGLAKPLQQLLAKYTAKDIRENLHLQPAAVKTYYLRDNNGAAMKMITVLSLAAIFILLMAIINFVNINIGTSSYRLKEIGLRKVFGGARKQLIIQFVSEAMILTAVSTIVSLIFYEALRNVFGQILNTSFISIFQFSAQTFLLLAALVLFTGFVAGIYPAFVLSAAKVVNAVKGKIETERSRFPLRKAMLVVQFTLAAIVLASSIIVSQQVSFIFSKDIGYSKEQLMVLSAFPKQWDSIGTNKMLNNRDALAQIPGVKAASLSFEVPDRKPPNVVDMQAVNGDGRTVLVTSCGTDEKYAAALGLQMLSGTCFSQSGGYIPNQIVINESAAKALGFTPASAVNRQMKIPSSPGQIVTIAGVIKDYNYSSLQEQIQPVAFFNVKDWVAYRYLSLKLSADNISQTITRIKDEWKRLSPNAPFEYTFMDDKFRSLYQSELQLKKASYTATTLAVIIVLLGVVGLIAVSIQKRVKEIGIRKVLGSSVAGIMMLFVKEFVWIIIIAAAIACPLSYLIMQGWLNDYAYRIGITAEPFLITFGCLSFITVLLICLQTTKAAITNPVKSLRTE